jgi:hypothetical protein
VTGFPYAGGGLNAGDYFDLTNDEAQGNQYATNGQLYSGRYRYVQVDSGATAANVKTGTVGFVRAGSSVKSAVTLTVGSGQTNGTFQIAANPGSGAGIGAILSVTIAGGVIVGQPSVVAAGFGYVSPPTFTVAQGGTPGTVVAQLGISQNIVTSADIAIGTASLGNAGIGPIHPVVFLNTITPGNYGFVQESGVATVLAGATFTQTQSQNALPVSGASANGTMTTSSASYSIYNIGEVIDPLTAPLANTPFKIQMTTPIFQD